MFGLITCLFSSLFISLSEYLCLYIIIYIYTNWKFSISISLIRCKYTLFLFVLLNQFCCFRGRCARTPLLTSELWSSLCFEISVALVSPSVTDLCPLFFHFSVTELSRIFNVQGFVFQSATYTMFRSHCMLFCTVRIIRWSCAFFAMKTSSTIHTYRFPHSAVTVPQSHRRHWKPRIGLEIYSRPFSFF